MRKKIQNLIFATIGLISTIIFFQNCGTEFQIQNFDVSSSLEATMGTPPFYFDQKALIQNTNEAVTLLPLVIADEYDYQSLKFLCFLNSEPISCEADETQSSSRRVMLRMEATETGHQNLDVEVLHEAQVIAKASVSWMYDTSPPVLEITPLSVLNFSSDTSLFRIQIDEFESGIESLKCSLNDALFENCETELSLKGLVPGDYSLSVRTVDKAGNHGTALYRWKVRAQGETFLEFYEAPQFQTEQRLAKFQFIYGGDISYLTCSVDGEPEANCTDGQLQANVSYGPHTITVRGYSQQGGMLIDSIDSFEWNVFQKPVVKNPSSVVVTGDFLERLRLPIEVEGYVRSYSWDIKFQYGSSGNIRTETSGSFSRSSLPEFVVPDGAVVASYEVLVQGVETKLVAKGEVVFSAYHLSSEGKVFYRDERRSGSDITDQISDPDSLKSLSVELAFDSQYVYGARGRDPATRDYYIRKYPRGGIADKDIKALGLHFFQIGTKIFSIIPTDTFYHEVSIVNPAMVSTKGPLLLEGNRAFVYHHLLPNADVASLKYVGTSYLSFGPFSFQHYTTYEEQRKSQGNNKFKPGYFPFVLKDKNFVYSFERGYSNAVPQNQQLEDSFVKYPVLRSKKFEFLGEISRTSRYFSDFDRLYYGGIANGRLGLHIVEGAAGTDILDLKCLGVNPGCFFVSNEKVILARGKKVPFAVPGDFSLFGEDDEIFSSQAKVYHYNPKYMTEPVLLAGLSPDDLRFGDTKKLVVGKSGAYFLRYGNQIDLKASLGPSPYQILHSKFGDSIVQGGSNVAHVDQLGRVSILSSQKNFKVVGKSFYYIVSGKQLYHVDRPATPILTSETTDLSLVKAENNRMFSGRDCYFRVIKSYSPGCRDL